MTAILFVAHNFKPENRQNGNSSYTVPTDFYSIVEVSAMIGISAYGAYNFLPIPVYDEPPTKSKTYSEVLILKSGDVLSQSNSYSGTTRTKDIRVNGNTICRLQISTGGDYGEYSFDESFNWSASEYRNIS